MTKKRNKRKEGKAKGSGIDSLDVLMGVLGLTFVAVIAIFFRNAIPWDGKYGLQEANAATEVRSTGNVAAKGILVVDSKAIFESFMATVQERIALGEEMSKSQLHFNGQEFGAEYLRAIKK